MLTTEWSMQIWCAHKPHCGKSGFHLAPFSQAEADEMKRVAFLPNPFYTNGETLVSQMAEQLNCAPEAIPVRLPLLSFSVPALYAARFFSSLSHSSSVLLTSCSQGIIDSLVPVMTSTPLPAPERNAELVAIFRASHSSYKELLPRELCINDPLGPQRRLCQFLRILGSKTCPNFDPFSPPSPLPQWFRYLQHHLIVTNALGLRRLHHMLNIGAPAFFEIIRLKSLREKSTLALVEAWNTVAPVPVDIQLVVAETMNMAAGVPNANFRVVDGKWSVDVGSSWMPSSCGVM
jgi:hypothetical protein